jgi:hypothetical protein
MGARSKIVPPSLQTKIINGTSTPCCIITGKLPLRCPWGKSFCNY